MASLISPRALRTIVGESQPTMHPEIDFDSDGYLDASDAGPSSMAAVTS